MKIGVISLGCDKNRCNTETMLSYLVRGDYELTNEESEADVIIINTCAFIESARKEAIDTIFEIAQLKVYGNLKKLIITGCLPEKYVKDIFDEIPEVDAFLGVNDYPLICEVIEKIMVGERVNAVKTCNVKPSIQRYLTTPFNYAYLMVADGCNNHCTYCTIPQIRGKYKSKEFNDVLMEAAELAAEGVKEIILVAQDLTSYGIDLYDKFRLTEVIEEISKIEGVEQIRLLYCYPEKVDDNLIATIKNNPSVVKYIDIPLQHSSNKVLKLMGRKGTHEEYVALFEKLYKEIPEIAIRSTVMVGFPGETEEDFEDLLKFVDQVKPINLGVFMYSDEEDAPSCKLPNKVNEETKQRRYDILIDKLSQISREKKMAFVGKPLDVVYEDIDYDQGMFIGRSYISAPEIDSLVFFTSKKPLNAGENVKVLITDVINDDLYGEAL